MATPPNAAHWDDRTVAAPMVCAATAWNGLGFDSEQIWAFRRAELTAVAETPFRLAKGDRATMVPIQTLPPRSQGAARLTPVVTRLLAPLLARLAALPRRPPVPVLLSLPERWADGAPAEALRERRQVEAAVAERVRAAGLEPQVRSFPRGHAGLAHALLEIGPQLVASKVEVALVGGLDTYYDRQVVDQLDRDRRLFDGENLDSFIPGEGGAFLLLALRNVARRAGWPVLARLEGVAVGTEPQPMRGTGVMTAQGLTAALRPLCDRLQSEKRNVDWWLADVTHESYRAHEWQVAFPRASAGVSGPETAMEFLPAFLGDLGAASMATGVAIAAESFARGDPPATTCMVTGSSTGPDRGALLLSKVTG